MGCLKKILATFMKQCHIPELMANSYQFSEEHSMNNTQMAIENNIPPEIPARSKIELVSEFVIQNICREKEAGSILYLNLFSNRIKQIKALDSLVNLTTLILSFNQIEAIEGLQECAQLKTLDLSHNFIRKIEGLQSKQSLQSLNLVKNWIQDITHLDHLKLHAPQLRQLALKCNPIAAKKSYRAQVFMRLPNLQKLDDISITEKDKEMVKNDFIVLNEEIIFDALKVQKKNVSNYQPPQGNQIVGGEAQDWQKTIEILILNHKKVSKIRGLEGFVNLRKLKMIDNCLVKIEGLGRCKLLEELSLEKNKITQIEEIQHLRYLKKLDLGRNRVKKIDNGLANLDNLTQLSIEDNCIA
mmetsp:Transcript_8729/g.8018  ORF Transcript_8729/g.8018 Transcript_8729/m.8018 type:complete len:356 (+) Transcript_8729:184-1251(+)